MPNTATQIRLTLIVLLSMGLTACMSEDKHVFISTVHLPATITLYDPMTDQSVWSKDVPVGQKLVIDMDREEENELVSISGLPATMLTWEIYDIMSEELLVEEQVALPGIPIVIKVNYRPSPEYAPGYEPPYSTTTPITEITEIAQPEASYTPDPVTATEIPEIEPVDEITVPVEEDVAVDPAPVVEPEPAVLPAPEEPAPPMDEPEEPAIDEVMEEVVDEEEMVDEPVTGEESVTEIDTSTHDIQLELELEESLSK